MWQPDHLNVILCMHTSGKLRLGIKMNVCVALWQ